MAMQSKTDQVHSYQFFLQRVVSGLVAKESDPADVPFRRLGWAGFGSVMVAVLVVAGFGVYGLVVGGGASSWRDGGSIIVEKETGAPYVYRDGRLHPMLNLVSAQLALGGNAAVSRVSARSLASVPRGPTLGIPGAPAGLPGNGNLLTGGWTFCSQLRPDGRGGQEAISVLGVGQAPDGGAVPLDGRALLVHDVDGDESDLQLVWRGHRFALTDAEPALRALGVGRESAISAAAAWVGSLPLGDPLRPPSLEHRGEPTRALGETPADLEVRTGQVIEVAGAFYAVAASELVEITELQADLVLVDPATAAAYPDRAPQVRTDVPPSALATAVVESLPAPTATSPPPARPEFAPVAPEDLRDGAVCATFGSGQFTPEVVAGGRLPWHTDAIATPRRTAEGGLLADYVLVAGGHAVLVQAMASPDAEGGAGHLVTDQGIRYPLAGPEVLATLGLDPERQVRVPAGLLARLPAGPALDPAVALEPVPLPGVVAEER